MHRDVVNRNVGCILKETRDLEQKIKVRRAKKPEPKTQPNAQLRSTEMKFFETDLVEWPDKEQKQSDQTSSRQSVSPKQSEKSVGVAGSQPEVIEI